jgi:hypothetical protein
MRHRDKEYEQARALRQQGMSIREICKHVPAAKSTISVWVRDMPLTEEQISRLDDNRVRGRERACVTKAQNRNQRWAAYRRAAEEEYITLCQDADFMFGLALYIGEGSKGVGSEINITNWNHEIILKGIEFLEKLGILRGHMRCKIMLHPSQDCEQSREFWKAVTGFTDEQVRGPYQTISPGSRGKRGQRWPCGGCQLVASSIELRHKLNRWMELALRPK